MKKLFLLFWALLATTTLWAHDFEVDGIYYNYIDNNNVAVTYKGNSYSSYSNEYSGEVTIPSTVTYNGTTYSVTSIGNYAFRNCSSLTSITIPNSVTSIGIEAFRNCSSLTSITIPNSVTSIGYQAFWYCSSLTSVTIGNSVTSIEDHTFEGCQSLISVTIGNSVTSIGEEAFWGTGIYNDNSNWENDVLYINNCLIEAKESISGTYTIKENTRLIAAYAFNNCSSLTSITIPNSVTSIGDQAFEDCSSLTSITIPNSVTSIGDQAFEDCSSLTSITIPNSVTSIGDQAFEDCSSLTSITIPNSVTSIGLRAFYNCSSLTSITIPNSVTSIGLRAFYNCSSLTSVTIGNSVTSIGVGAFYRCSSLTSIVVETGNTTYDSRDNCNAIIETATNTLIAGCQNTVIPNSVTSIGVGAFLYCYSLTSVTIPNSVTSIGNWAFAYCSSLTSITIPNSVTSIGEVAFCYCESFTSITIPNSVTTVGGAMFYGCSKLKSVVLSNNITSLPSYRDSSNDNGFFEGCSSLTSVTIPESVTSIGDDAFYNCTKLTSVTWNAKNYPDFSSSSSAPFYYSRSQITNFVFGDSVEHIPAYLCYGMNKLKAVTLARGITSIGGDAFYDCSSLYSVSNLSGLDIVKGSTTHGYVAYYANYVYKGNDIIGDFVFAKYEGKDYVVAYLGSDCQITLPENYRGNSYGIGACLFGNNSSVNSITISNAITSIGDYAFSGCSNLNVVYIGNSVLTIGKDAFYDCPQLYKVIMLPNTVPSGINSAFQSLSGRITYVGNTNYQSGYSVLGTQRVYTNLNSYFSVDGIVYALVNPSKRTCDIIDCDYSGATAEFSIGNSVVYKNVTLSIDSININAFRNNTKITKMIVDCNHSLPSHMASGCSLMDTLIITANVGNIGQYAFQNCSSLENVTIKNNGTIGVSAFESSSKGNPATYVISNVGLIDKSAFAYCSAIKTLLVDTCVGNIGQYAFQNCSSLENVTIKNNGTIGVSAFESSSKGNPATYVISNVGLIDKSAFAYCSAIKTLLVDTCVGNIGQYAFQNCSSLENVTIKNNGTIGLQAFKRSSTENPATYVISNVGLIDESAFANCSAIKTLLVDTCVGNIGQYAFQNCSSLENVTIKNNGTIGVSAFKSSSTENPATYVISNVGLIGESAFANCTALENCTIRNNGLIGESAFANCTKLQKVRFGNQVGNINQRAFYNCVLLDSLTLPNSVKTLGASVFYNCNDLAFVQLSNTLSSIGNAAFDRCSSLPKIFIPKSVSSIGEGAFNQCTSLSVIGFEDGTNPLSLGSNSVNKGLFYDCPLDSVYIGRELTYQKTEAYGYSPFYRSPTLRSIVISDVPSKVETNEFYGCTNLYYVLIGNGAQSIGDYAFSGCSSIDYFSFGSQLQTIGAEAFSDCVAMTRLYSYCQQPPTCGASALEDIDKWNCTLYIPDGTIDAYTAADQWKDFFFIEEDDKTYTITWKNEDGSIIDQTEVPYGQMPTHSIPTKPSTEQYTYTFAGWSPEVVLVSGDATYTATYTSTLRQYTITFLDEDGTILSSQAWDYGTMPTCDEPIKPADAQYTYTFAGWTPTIVAVTADATYIATFNKTVNKYTITATAENGTVQGTGEYDYGTVVDLMAVADTGYKFDKWSDELTDNPRTVTVTENLEFTALFILYVGSSVEDIHATSNKVQKVLIDGILYILRDGKTYNVMGQEL